MPRSARVTARAAALLASVACIAFAAESRAQEPDATAPKPAAVGLDLRWSAPPECPDEAAVRKDIEELAGRRIAPSEGAGIQVEASVARQDVGRWAVEITSTRAGSDSATRRVEGRTCAEVARAAVSIVALALDPPAAPTPPPPPPPPPKPREPPPPPPRPPPARASWTLFAVGGVDAAALPRVAPGLGVGAGLAFGDNRLEVRATAWLPETATLTPDSGAHLWLVAGDARYCRAFGKDVAFAPCLGVEAGAIHAQGFGLRKDDSPTGLWLAPEIAGVLTWRVAKHFALAFEAEALAPLVRDRYRVEADAVLHRPGPIDGRGLVGVRVEGL